MKQDETEMTGRTGMGVWGTMRSQWGNHAGFGRMRFGQRGWLKPSVLGLLEEKPMNGMEIINRFYEASHGWWKPSPGSVYPLLESLEAEGLIKKGTDGRYSPTKKLKEQDGASEGQVEEMLTNLEGTLSYFEDMEKSDRRGLTKYRARLVKISDRLSKLK